MKYKTYPKVKDSEIVGVDTIPEKWGEKRLKFTTKFDLSTVDRHEYDDEIQVSICHYPQVYHNEKITIQTKLPQGTCNEKELEKFRLKKDDVLITKDSETPNDIGVPVYIEDNIKNAVCGYHIAQLSTDKNQVLGIFLFRFIQSNFVNGYFETETNGVTRYGLGKDSINNLRIPIPTISEQKSISKFFEKNISIITNQISKNQNLIERLKEKRQATINQAVTKGLDLSVKMEDSEVEWIGEIPEKWEMIKLKFLGKSKIGIIYDPDEVVDNEEQGILVLRSSNIQNGKSSFLDTVYVNKEIGRELLTQKNDILICSRNGSHKLIGKNLMIDETLVGTTFGAFMTIFRSKYNKFISKVLNSPIFLNQKGLFITTTINQLTIGTLNNFMIPFPKDDKERNDIVDFLDIETSKIDSLIFNNELQIKKLKELRQSLISSIITGKIDVRDNIL